MSAHELVDIGPVRLLQYRPAWSLHATLRALKVQYTTENVPESSALGKKLPILIHGSHVLPEKEVWNYIREIHPESKLISNSLDDGDAFLWRDFIELNLVTTFTLLKKVNGEAVDEERKARSRNIGLRILNALGRNAVKQTVLDNFVSSQREFDETESELLNKLSTSYGILDGQLISGSPRSLGGPEVQAKLWGHLVDALSSDAVGRIVHSYPNLVKFFNDATHQIFQSSSQYSDIELLNNNFVLNPLEKNTKAARETTAVVLIIHDVPSRTSSKSSLIERSVWLGGLQIDIWDALGGSRTLAQWSDEQPVASLTLSGLALTAVVASSFVYYALALRR